MTRRAARRRKPRAQRVREQPVADKRPLTTVLRVAPSARKGRLGNVTGDPDGAGIGFDGLPRVLHEFVAQQRAHPDTRSAAGSRCVSRPLCCSWNATCGVDKAMRRNTSSQCPYSVCSVRRNLRRAGSVVIEIGDVDRYRRRKAQRVPAVRRCRCAMRGWPGLRGW